MDDLNENALAWYRQGGVELVNSALNVEFSHIGDRLRALEALEQSGNWRILWHDQSRLPGETRDFGIVIEYLGDEQHPR
ncbi:MAG TPA: hypothetical protein VG757_01880 [Devosia sp.]|nr:hypothetical protein [Devosia sp.]